MSLSLKVARSGPRRVGPGAGDPGLFGFVGKVVSGLTGAASRVLPGPLGAAAGVVSRLTRPAQKDRPQFIRDMPISEQMKREFEAQRFGPQMPRPGIVGAAQRFMPGGETGYQDAPPIGAPSGYHVNKTAYFLKDGTYIAEGSRWVRNRRRNPLNPRAASKAIGRIEALKKATSRFSRITIRKKPC